MLIGDLILTEVLQGFRTDSGYRQASTLLDPLSLRQLGGRAVALAAADNYRYLRARGVTIRKTIDVIIASYCLLHDLDLLHSDRDFVTETPSVRVILEHIGKPIRPPIRAPPFLATDWLLGAFAETREDAVAAYRRFVAEGMGAASPWLELKGQVYLGSEPFVERMQALIDPKRPLQDIPKRQRRALANPLDYYASRYADRGRALVEAYRTGAYSMQTIAEHFGVSRMTVSRAVNHNEHTSVGTSVTCEV